MVSFFCNNYVQTLADHHVDAPHETPHLYSPRDFSPGDVAPHDTVFVKTDFLDHFVASIRPLIRAPFRLVTGHSDLSPSQFAVGSVMRDAGISRWFAQNTAIENFKIRALPMGFSEPSRTFGNQEVIAKARDKFATFRGKRSSIAVPPTGPTHPIRAAVAEAVNVLSGSDVSSCIDVAEVKMTFAEYLDFVGKREFCLVPRGNAIDCHRIYECVVVRTIPVIVSDEVPAFCNRLPVIVLQPVGDETVCDVIGRFVEDVRSGLTPPLPTEEQWEAAIASISVSEHVRLDE
jgi:hypothetical protein